jgi:hypothetical protein
MITNNLIIRLKTRDAEHIAEAKARLLGMRGKIPTLVDCRVETEARSGESAYDIMYIATYKSLEDLNAYLVHPVHVETAEYLKGVLDSIASLCYES